MCYYRTNEFVPLERLSNPINPRIPKNALLANSNSRAPILEYQIQEHQPDIPMHKHPFSIRNASFLRMIRTTTPRLTAILSVALLIIAMMPAAHLFSANDSAHSFATLQAQDTGSLSGYVRDAVTGEPLIGANVGIPGTSYGAATDADGYYTIREIPLGSYTLVATFVGYERQERINITVRSAGMRDINFRLTPLTGELEEVVVSVSEPLRAPAETPVSYRRLSPEEISTYPAGNGDIAKVVQSLPGVSGSVTGFRNDVIIRGGAPNENVYYLDGIEIPSINHFSTQGSAGGPAGLLNVALFEGVELSTSAFSAAVPDALSGVLTFNQRNGNDREARTQFRVGASEAAITTEGPLFRGDERFSDTTYLLSVRRSYLQLLFKAIGLPFLPDYWDYQYRINHNLNARNRITFIGVGSVDDFSINVPDELDDNQQAILEQVPVIQQRSNTTGLTWQHRSADGLGLINTSLSTSFFYNDFRRYADNENQTGLFSQNEARELRTTLRSNVRLVREKSTLTFGGSLRHNGFSNNFFNNNPTSDAPALAFDDRMGFFSFGAFVQTARENILPGIDLTAGVRVDGNSFTDRGGEFWRTLSPRAALTWRIDEGNRWQMAVSAGRYFKLPPLNLLGYKENDQFVNRDAAYTRSDHLTAGLSFFPRPSTVISAEAFVKWYEDYPVSVREEVSLANLGADFGILGNEPVAFGGKGRTYGVEFQAQQTFVKNVYGIAAYTLFWSEFTNLDRAAYLPSAWDSRHLFTFTGGYRLGSRWEFSLRTRWIGETPFAKIDREQSVDTYPAFVIDYETLRTNRLSPFSATDLRIDRKFDFRGSSLDIYLEIQNLFGQNTPSEPNFLLRPNPQGVPVIFEVEEIQESSVLPTIGIIFDF